MRGRLGSSGATKVDGGQDNGAVKAQAVESNLRWISAKKCREYGVNPRRERTTSKQCQ